MKKPLFKNIISCFMLLTFIIFNFEVPVQALGTNDPAITVLSSNSSIKDIVEVTIANGTTNAKDWVGLYNENDIPGDSSTGGVASIWWKYLPDLNIQNGNGAFKLELSTISNIQEGKNYKLVLFKDDSYVSLASVPFSISTSSVPLQNLQSIQIKTKVDVAPKLPSVVTKVNSDSTTEEVNVLWNTVDVHLYSKAGSFTVEGTVQGISEKAIADVTVIEGDGPLYSFQILSDTHINSDLNSAYDKNLDSALKDISKVDPNSSGIIINGDTTDKGLKKNWDAFATILSKNTHSKVDLAFGNHDTWQEDTWVDQGLYNVSKQNFLDYSGESNIYYDYWMQDNHFIVLGSEKSNGNVAYFSDTQLKWFDETLKKDSTSNKPIFVFIHQPLYDTVAGSKPGQGWNGVEQDKQVKDILGKYPQAILFTGHTHWEFGSKSIMYNDKYCTMFNIPSVAYCWTDENIGNDISEGYYIEVYKDKVLVKGRNFTTREWAENAQYEVSYSGTDINGKVKVTDNFASINSQVPQLNNLELNSDKEILELNGVDKAKLTLKATMTNETVVDLTKNAIIQYTSDNSNVAKVDSDGIVMPVSKGVAKITARVTVNGLTQSSTQQIKVEKIKTDATISEITIDGKGLNGFASDTLQYNIQLSSNTKKVPTVAAIASDSNASVIIKQASSVQEYATVEVISANGQIKKIYKIKFGLSNNVINVVANPIFSLDSKLTYTEIEKLSISCDTNGSVIRYTTDGTDPNENSQVYSNPITLDGTTTVRAIAIKYGLMDSEIVSSRFVINAAIGTEFITNGEFTNGAAGWIGYNEADLSPSGVENGIYKTTIGDVGTYSYSIELTQGDFKLRAGSKYRLTFNAKSTIDRKIQPVIEQNDIGYTRYLDKITALTSEMNTYTYDFIMESNEDIAHLVFCMGNVGGVGSLDKHDICIDNVSLKEVPETTEEPSFSIARGTYSSEQNVAINCGTEDAMIRYTTDGTAPTVNSSVYSGPIKVSSNTTIKAYASKVGLVDSRVAGVTYKFAPTAEPTFSVNGGIYTKQQTVSISCATEDAIIRYTTDGTDPTINSQIYSGSIRVDSTTTIKAYAFKAYHNDSRIISNIYLINIPIVPIVKDDQTVRSEFIDISKNAVVDKDIFNAVKGLDKNITFTSNEVTWTFNGKEITSEVMSNIDLSLKTVPDTIKDKETLKLRNSLGKDVPIFSFSFNHEGKLPGKATVKIFAGTDWANKNITVFIYYADKDSYEKITTSDVGKDGYFSFTTDHCSDYFIVETKNLSGIPQTGYPNFMSVLFQLGAVMIVAGVTMLYSGKKKKKSII